MTNAAVRTTKGRKRGRMNKREREVLDTLLPLVRIPEDTLLDKKEVFGRNAPLYLEIGFGNGAFLLEKAQSEPECDFIGIEIYLTGIAKLLVNMSGAENHDSVETKNIRIYNGDARHVLACNIPPCYLDGVFILFPDPWHKKRHNKRRLVKPDFVNILASCLKPEGFIVAATDHEEYAREIEEAFLSAGFTGVEENVPEIRKTSYALKARQKRDSLIMYRFSKT